ncbi:hypothetical protein, partial [Lactobacillus delbrueckii]
LTPNLTAFTGVDSQNLPDVMVSVQFILAIGEFKIKPITPFLFVSIHAKLYSKQRMCVHAISF